jgi:hypothetical protein
VDQELVREALKINQKKFDPEQPIRRMTYVKKI